MDAVTEFEWGPQPMHKRRRKAKRYYRSQSSARRAAKNRGLRGVIIFRELIDGEIWFSVWL